jgi:hypothetical protein
VWPSWRAKAMRNSSCDLENLAARAERRLGLKPSTSAPHVPLAQRIVQERAG